MAISRASDSSIQDGLPKYNDIWDGTTATSAFDSLGTVVVGSAGQASIIFSNIPATYTHLQIRSMARSNRASQTFDDIRLRINNDTSTTFRYHALYGDGASALVDTTGALAYVMGAFGSGMTGSTATANNFASSIIDILDYSNTNKNKTIRGLCGLDNNGSGIVSFSSSLWTSTTAITSIEISALGSTIQQYSSFSLYGIK